MPPPPPPEMRGGVAYHFGLVVVRAGVSFGVEVSVSFLSA